MGIYFRLKAMAFLKQSQFSIMFMFVFMYLYVFILVADVSCVKQEKVKLEDFFLQDALSCQPEGKFQQ